MGDQLEETKPIKLESEVKNLKLEEDDSSGPRSDGIPTTSAERFGLSAQLTPNGLSSPHKLKSKASTQSPIKSRNVSQSPVEQSEREEVVGGDITLKLEPGKAPKLSRSTSHKVISKPLQLFSDAPDKTAEATGTFTVIPDCAYAAKYLGYTEHALECDCAEEWDSATRTNHACGDDSDCINRATKMECVGDCGCGPKCQNQRFQRKQYANVTVFKTEKKGYGLRANSDLRPHDFIFEYIGEVINESAFRRRMHQYDDEGIKHFYFMSLSKGEFVDATKKGNLGRFCNHSCNPNCYVDKWVVGDKLRMGIFAERKINTGEELVFNYNVDRYGADPQPCYCGEPNCTGYIGGKTQTERATKLSLATIEALGIDDGEAWDTAVSKKPRKRKTGEDDEEYVNDIQPKSLDEGGVTKVMATLMQCKEKWIAVKLLNRIQRADEEKVMNRVVKMHGYQILNSALTTFIEDFNVVSQVFNILNKLPRLTRNKIQDSKIEATVQRLTDCGDERVQAEAASLLKIWSALEIGYRIPRMKRDPNISLPAPRTERLERRDTKKERSKSRSRSRSRSLDAPKGPAAPSGPRNGMPQRNANFFPGPRPAFRRPPPSFTPLPAGWFLATSNGQTYYYSASGQTTWQRPTTAAIRQPPPPPPKAITHEQRLQEIINDITSKPKEATPVQATPEQTAADPRKEKKDKKDKWKNVPEEKQRRIYENTIAPLVKHVMDKYSKKLPKEELKVIAKKASKKVVSGDFKHKKVADPGHVSKEHQQSVKTFVQDCFERHLKDQARRKERKKRKQAEHEARAAAQVKEKEVAAASCKPPGPIADVPAAPARVEDNDSEDEDGISDDEPDLGKPASSAATSPTTTSPNGDTELKRKRTEEDGVNGLEDGLDDSTPNKKARPEEYPPPPPPPPPPPAAGDMPIGDAEDVSEVRDDVEFEYPGEGHDFSTGQASESVTGEGVEDVREFNQYPTEASGFSYELSPPDAILSFTNGKHSPRQLATPNTTTPDDKDSYGLPRYDQIDRDRRQQLDVGGGS